MIIKNQLTFSPDSEMLVSEIADSISQKEWGTFKDSLKAPIHQWFTYPAGFSYKAVESSIKNHNIKKGHTIYDPFMGSGTTNVVAKKLAVNSYGLEAHPFIFEIAKAKLDWSITTKEVTDALQNIEGEILSHNKDISESTQDALRKEFPELILKCYEKNTLQELLIIRDSIAKQKLNDKTNRLLFVGLASLLRQISSVATGWPYIAPKKKKTTSNGKLPFIEYKKFILGMLYDIELTISQADPYYADSNHNIFNADSRNTLGLIENSSIDHIFTSPPYLNNFDYADRTRLELYFFGKAKTWGDITRTIRSKLMTSATTQILRNDPRYILSNELHVCCPEVFSYLCNAVQQLSQLRLQKGGKKSYDLLVAGYFNDMYESLKDAFRVLKNGKTAVYVLGDSAPYGVHVPTDLFIGKIGIGLGFSDYKIEVLRPRGGKWGNNPQRHKVNLRESVVTLRKD